MNIDDIYAKLQRFSVAAINDATCNVIIPNQNKPSSRKPYITLALSGFRNVSKPILKDLNDFGIRKVVIPSLITASFNAYADGLHSAEIFLNKLYVGFNTELVNNIFLGKLSFQRTLKNITAIPVPLNSQMESRAILEIELAFNIETTDNVGLIEHVYLKDELSNKEYIINKQIEN